MSKEFMTFVIENEFILNQFAELKSAFGGNPAFFKTKP
jgi:hypothetical protein